MFRYPLHTPMNGDRMLSLLFSVSGVLLMTGSAMASGSILTIAATSDGVSLMQVAISLALAIVGAGLGALLTQIGSMKKLLKDLWDWHNHDLEGKPGQKVWYNDPAISQQMIGLQEKTLAELVTLNRHLRERSEP